MNITTIVSVIIIFSSSLVFSETQYVGHSSFAAMSTKYPCSRFLEIARHSSHPSMTVLYRTFGDDVRCIKRFLNRFKDRKHLLQIHLTNETCRRVKGHCESREILHRVGVREYNRLLERGDNRIKRAIEQRVLEVNNLLSLTNKNTKVIVSTGLEDNYTDKAYLRVLGYVREKLDKRIEIARSPVKKFCSIISSAKYCELHLKDSDFGVYSPKRCIWNNDGGLFSAAEQLKLFYKFSRCPVLFSWEPVSQGRETGKGFIRVDDRRFILPFKLVREYSRMFQIYDKKSVH